MEAWEVLEHGADVIDLLGWAQGHLVDKCTGAVCAIGAMDYASDGAGRSSRHDCWLAWEVAFAALQSTIGQLGVASWNDFPGRTKEEVTSAMRTAASVLKAARTEGTRQQAAESTDAKVVAENADALV